MMEKTINMILLTQHFPPEISGGIGRPLSLYKYLPKYDINVIIVTTRAYGYLEREENIYRYESSANWRESSFFSIKRLWKYVSFILNKSVSLYTDLYWYYNAKKNVGQYLKDKRIDLLYATFPNIETLKLGYTLSKKYRIPLITEFRDGLVYESIFGRQNWIKESERKKFEQKVVKNSNVIITIGNNLSQYFQKTYPDSIVKTVFNGYDREDFIRTTITTNRLKDKDVIKIALFGSLDQSRKRSPGGSNLFTAIKSLLEEGLLEKNKLQLHLIGRYSKGEKIKILNNNINEYVFFKGVMPKDYGLAYIKKNFDYVLFYGSPNETTIISSKLLEYLYLGMPIIGICKGNEAEDIIKLTGTGEVCDFDLDSVKRIFMKAQKREIAYNPKQNEIVKFDREYQARQIAQIIDEVLKK